MRIILKIIAAPFVVILTPMVAILTFLFCTAAGVLNIISGIAGLLGILALVTGETTTGIAVLVLAFLLSPFGITAAAGWILDKLGDLNYSLKNFIIN